MGAWSPSQDRIPCNPSDFRNIGCDKCLELDRLVDEEDEQCDCKNKSKLVAPTAVDLSKDVLGEEEIKDIDLGKNSIDEDEEHNLIDICIDKVVRDGYISPRHQRSGRNKNKKEKYGRQIVGMVEKNRGQLSTGIVCYMRDYSVSTKEAMAKFQEMGESGWKDIKGMLRPTPIAMEFLSRILLLGLWMLHINTMKMDTLILRKS
ncbi:5-epiaristolochene synthase [Capsicum baccatum]|uniref:5-epiaristolochene synthase n=1 Tax=Capsicum baccatum TaxID=33114 RepID=A0A2G2VCV2_CAPBA|nr:5-epiaristolochene synthase [Capsicum baccatum]